MCSSKALCGKKKSQKTTTSQETENLFFKAEKTKREQGEET